MTWKRLLLAATAAAAVGTAPYAVRPAAAEEVTPVVTQSQANRLSLFHDYGLTAIGTANDVGAPANVGNPNDVGGPFPGAPGTGVLTGSLPASIASTDPSGPGRSFQATFAPLAGYDANPEANRIAHSGAFVGGDLGVAYRFTDGPDDPIVGAPLRATFAYDVLGAIYEGPAQNADALQQDVSASVRQTLLDNSIVLASSVTDAFTILHGEAFLDTVDAGATAEFLFVPQASVEIGYDYTHLEYFFQAKNRSQDPTGDRHTFIAKAHLYTLPQRRGATVGESPDVLSDLLRGGLRRATVNFAHVWNRPEPNDGHDYTYESTRIGIGLEGLTLPARAGARSLGELGRNLSLDVGYAHEFQGFEYANTGSVPILAGKPKKGYHRKDGIDILTLRANARLFDLPHDAGTLGTFLQYEMIRDGSNIVDRHFNEYVVSGGVTYRY